MPRNISWSEIQTLKRCRKKWYWSYDRFIEPKAVEPAPLLGRVGHEAFAILFRGGDPKEYLRKWLQEATETHVDLTLTGEWEESSDIEAEWEEMAFILEGIIDRYRKDAFLSEYRIVDVEHEFNIPLPEPLGGYVLHGYVDAILEDYQGLHYLYERKFIQYAPKRKRYGSFRDEMKLEMDGQIGLYEWALLQEGFKISGSIHEQILGTLPKIPKLLKKGNTLNGGKVSVAKCKTDWETFASFVELQGESPEDYIDLKESLDRNEFFRRTFLYRTPEEVHNYMTEVLWFLMQAKELDTLRNNVVDLAPHTWMVLDQGCPICPFKPLCFEILKGRDPTPIIETEYQPRERRKEEIVPEEPVEEEETKPQGEEEEEETHADG